MVRQDLRLRNVQGEYRWYALRAKVVAGPQSTIDRCIGTLTDINTSKDAEEQLVANVMHDQVTGLPGRAIFMDRLERELSKAIPLPMRLLVIDITKGDGWQKLCPFLGVDVVATPFPHLYAANDLHPEEAAGTAPAVHA